jgi:hypothetical protein
VGIATTERADVLRRTLHQRYRPRRGVDLDDAKPVA